MVNFYKDSKFGIILSLYKSISLVKNIKLKLFIYVLGNVVLRVLPILASTIVAIMLNNNITNSSFSIYEKLLIIIPVSYVAMFFFTKLTDVFLTAILKIHFIKIFSTVGYDLTYLANKVLYDLPLNKTQHKSPAEWSNLLNKKNDIVNGFAIIWGVVVPLIFEMVLTSVFLYSLGYRLIFVVYLLCIASTIILRFYFTSKIVNKLSSFYNLQSNIVHKSFDYMSKLYMAKIYKAEEYLLSLKRQEDVEEKMAYIKYKNIFVLTNFLQDLITALTLSFVVYYCYGYLKESQLSVGMFATILTLINSAVYQIREMSYAVEGALMFKAVVNPFIELFDSAKDADRQNNQQITTKKRTDFSKLSLNNIKLEYASTNQSDNFEVLKGISFEINPGEKIFIVGNSGSGKTSLIKILLGIKRQTGGEIVLNDVVLSDMDEIFSYVPQQLDLFDISILDNLKVGNNNLSKDEYCDSLESVGLSRIASLDISKSRIGELSGGENQRVAIARALLSNRPIMILDEPTSSLDLATEASILDLLMSKTELTLIMIIHRLHAIPADARVVVIKDGVVVETGKKKDLLEAGGAFASLIYHNEG